MGLWRYITDRVFGPNDPFWLTPDEKVSEVERLRRDAKHWQELYYSLRRQVAGYEAALETKERRCVALQDELTQFRNAAKR